MSESIKSLRSFLTKSPSVVYPEDVLAYLPAIEAENTKLREFVRHMYACTQYLDWDCCDCDCPYNKSDCDFKSRMSELGIEVNE